MVTVPACTTDPVAIDAVAGSGGVDGWRLWSSDVVGAVLRLAAATSGCRCAILVSPDDRGQLVSIASTDEHVTPHRAREWWTSAASADGDRAVEPGRGTVVAPIAHALGGLGPVLVLRDGGRTGPPALQCAERFADLLRALVKSSGVHESRRTAYEALFQIGTELQAKEIDAEKVFQLVIEHARDLLDSDVAWLALVDEDGGRVVVEAATGVTTSDFLRMEVVLGTGIGGVAVRERRPVSVRDHRRYDSGMPSSVHSALTQEGIVSVLCAPLMQETGTLGALYVGTRQSRTFTEADASLLSALAAQAAIAIRNAQLYRALTTQNETLERTFTIHRLLTDASLRGRGMHSIAFELARLIDRDVLIELEGPTARRYRYGRDASPDSAPEQVPVGEPPTGFAVDVMAGRTGFGNVGVLDGVPLDPVQRNAVEYGATIIALELVKEQAALDVEWRLQGEILEEMLKAGEPCKALRARAERLGVELEEPRRLVVLQPGPGTAASALLEIVRRTLRNCTRPRSGLVTQRGNTLVVAVAAHESGDREELFFTRLSAAASEAGAGFSGGLSATMTDLGAALRQAEAALALGMNSGQPDAVVRYEDLGPLRFLLDAPDTSEMVALVREHLGGLAAKDAARDSELLKTLQVYLETGGHQPTTAEQCHIHVSTLKYRLARIAEIIERPLGDPQVRFELGLAFAVLRILGILRVDPFAA